MVGNALLVVFPMLGVTVTVLVVIHHNKIKVGSKFKLYKDLWPSTVVEEA